MRKIIVVIFYQLLLLSALASSKLQQQLEADIEDGKLEHFSLIEAAFIVSGVTGQEELTKSLHWFQELIKDIDNINLIIRMEETTSAERLFRYLHATWLKTYKKEATTLLDIIQRKQYNCVSATVLYNLTCDELGLNTEAFETPSHVYTIFSNFSEYVMVENTSPMGFNITKNLREYSKYLARYFPDKLNYKIGLDRIYAYENSKGRRINNTELIGLMCYNQAYFAYKNENFPVAYNYVLLAQKFNEDSRSNTNFEISLYYKWGHHHFKQKKFYEAFSIFADAAYRYEDNRDFINNCVLAFKNTLSRALRNRDWELTEKCITEMEDLELLNEKDRQIQKNILMNWIRFLIQNKDKNKAHRAFYLFRRNYKSDESLMIFENLIKEMP